MIVRELLREGEALEGERIGIEIEVERVRNTEWVRGTPYWHVEGDGSLRQNGGEFITPPLRPLDLQTAVKEYYDAAKFNGYAASVRTSTHVHLNMQHKTLEEVAAICALYSVVEPVLFSLLSGDRDECTYCIPWYRASDQAARFGTLCGYSSVERIRDALAEYMCKYTALNLMPLRTFGTIEFRAASTFDKQEDLLQWVSLLRRITNLGTSYGTAGAVVNKADENLGELLEEVFLFGDDADTEEAIDLVYYHDSITVANSLVRTRRQEPSVRRIPPYEAVSARLGPLSFATTTTTQPIAPPTHEELEGLREAVSNISEGTTTSYRIISLDEDF